MPWFARSVWYAAFAIPLFAGGCIERIVTVKSDPPGALVYLNEQEVGRTPVSKEFLWYGSYSVVVRKDGYQTLKTQTQIGTPWWQLIPLDLITDLLPIHDERVLTYSLKPQDPVDPSSLVARGEQLQKALESGAMTKQRVPTTRHATTRPTTNATPRTQ